MSHAIPLSAGLEVAALGVVVSAAQISWVNDADNGL